ncbi:GmrSD restriction endonuclease domain-containing protein, partial [Sulfuricurvum sp.]|uniref:GmrSD restriction endonuclease domain-containing protein n=1 Tax=Sulfuricurvum sp. TaxID=2025608 RepID=UPI003BB5B7BE
VVDGLQRLSSIKKFMVDKKLKLQKLEFLSELNGKSYDDLDRNLKRVIEDTQLITYQIEAQTPKKVRYSIFHRINTGGLVLNAQEIRQALNQGGNGVQFLKDIAEDKVFKTIVGLKSSRMSDRELVLRFIAFKLPTYKEFTFNNMGEFLDDSMDKLDKIKDEVLLKNLKQEFLETLEFSEKVLGEGHRFSRSIADDHKTKSLNRSLFDVITVSLSNIEDKEKFLERKFLFLNKFLELLKDEQSEFTNAITKGTSGRGAVEMRFKIMNELIKEVLNEN